MGSKRIDIIQLALSRRGISAVSYTPCLPFNRRMRVVRRLLRLNMRQQPLRLKRGHIALFIIPPIGLAVELTI